MKKIDLQKKKMLINNFLPFHKNISDDIIKYAKINDFKQITEI